jgi:hypothetical protein
MCRDACFNALPILPALRAVLELGLINHPQFGRNEDLLDAEGEDFLLDGSRERTEKVVDLYLQRRVRVAAPTEELKASAMAGIKTAFIDACQRRMFQIDKIAADFGIKKVSFGVSVPLDPSAEEAPYQAVGTRASRFSNPMIVCNPPCLNVQIDPTVQVSGEQTIEEKDKEFVIAHEMIHIAKNHELIATVSYLAYSVLATGMWAAGVSGGVTLSSVLCTYGAVVGAAAVPFELFFYTLRRSQEQEADVEAIRYLKTNEGAKQYFEGIKNRGVVDDLEHPPIDRRIAYIQAAV